MSIKKLSLAAAISVSMMTAGISASLAADTCPCPPAAKENVRTPSSYGAGSAGTYKSYGTLKPWGGNAAGSTEISTSQSPVNKPTGVAASMAAKGMYGNCVQCPSGGAAAISQPGSSTITIQKQLGTPNTNAPVATPTTSSMTGGASSAQSQGMKCVEVPEKIPVTTGGAAQACPMPSCVPGATTGTRGADAPPGFSTQDNPGAIAPFQGTSAATGGAAPAEPKRHWWQRKEKPAPTGGASSISPCETPMTTGGASSLTPDDTSTSAPSSSTSTLTPPSNTTPLTPMETTPTLPSTSSTIGSPATPMTTVDSMTPSTSMSTTTTLTPASPTTTTTPMTSTTLTPSTPMTPAAPMTSTTIMQPMLVPANPMLQSAATCPALNPQCPTTTAVPTGGAATITPIAQPVTCPTMACPQSTVTPMCTSRAVQLPTLPAAAATSQPWQITGGAAPISSQISATCPTSSANAQYIERQTYSYPSSPATRNTMISTANNVIGLSPSGNGVTVANPINITPQSNVVSFGSYTGYPTGAAASIGCPTGGAAAIAMSPGAAVTRVLQTEQSTPITIQTSSGLTLQRYALVPGCPITGAAAPIPAQFSDIPSNFWASNSINRLASAGIISGYPDRTFKPNLPVSRAEFASMLVQGMNLQNTSTFNQQIFRDVPTNYWANNSIDKVYNQGLIAGYPNNTFRPSTSISRAEALTTLSKSIPASTTPMTANNADQILSQYQDGAQVPTWAKIPVAQALKGGLLQNSQNPNLINPEANATRADVASMISNLRQTLALEPQQQAQGPTGAAASIQQQNITVPTLSVKFNDDVSARTSNLGDKFTATTLEPVTINNVVYPIGSKVNGRIAEIIRPGNGQDGSLKLSFQRISAPNGESSALPRDVITAQVQKTSGKSLLTRLVEFPFVWPGRMVGTVGRTAGGMTVIAGNSSEQILGEGGAALGQVVAGNFGAAGRNGIQSAVGLGQGVLGIVRTALNGGAGLLNLSSDEIGYLVGADGSRIARIVPNDNVAIAFGCLE